MNNTEIGMGQPTGTRHAAVTGLAVVGFIALIILGVGLGVYSARFVPAVANTLGSAAVYLGSVFTPDSDSGITVVPSNNTSSTTISFGNGTTTTPIATTTAPTPKPKPKPTPTPVEPIPTTPPVYGLPDLTIQIVAYGYISDASNPETTFVEGTTTRGTYPAVKIRVTNSGTNYSGVTTLRAAISNDYKDNEISALAPSQYRDFVSAVTNSGFSQTITFTANPNQTFVESNYTNNQRQAVINP